MPSLTWLPPLAALALLTACASTPRGGGEPPPGSLTVASVRHSSGPQPAPQWLASDQLPAGTLRSESGRALQVEVGLVEGAVASVESAPPELANLVLRIEASDPEQTVVAVENRNEVPLAYELFLSPDGERWRRVRPCAVAARGTAYERWPGASDRIALGMVRTAASGAACD